MKKEYIIGGLALVGGIALVAYLLKPKAPSSNSEGFFGASGRMATKRGPCRLCKWTPNSDPYWSNNGYCSKGDYCHQTFKSVGL